MPRSVIRADDGVLPWALVTQVGAKGDTGSGGTGITDGDKGDVTVASSGASWTIKNGAVTTAKLATDAVDASKIAADAVGSSEIAANAVTASELAANAVTTGKIADAAVTAAKLGTDVASTLGVDDATLQARLTSFGRPQLVVIGSGDPVPAVTNGAFLVTLSGAATGSIGVTSLLAESKTGSTSVASTALSALGSGAVVTVLVTSYLSGATSGSPAPACTGLSGAGLTWTAVSLPATVTSNGNDTAKLFIGTGTGTAGALTATFGTAPTTAQFRVAQLTNATGTVVQATSATVTAGTGTPTISLPSAVLGTSVTLCWIAQNNATNANNPDPTFTEIGSAVSATGIRVSGEYKVPSTQTATWTTPISPSSYQKLLVIAEIS